jgi:asparagine synthase (glutamine-hydrolysing)
VVTLIPESDQEIINMSVGEALGLLGSDDPRSVLQIKGSFALVAVDGHRVRLARSLNRPLRYFLAKAADGPVLVVADRIDAIQQLLIAKGYGNQFHPSYTRMVPAHHVTEIQLVGCPDPNPIYHRFFDPPRATLPPNPETIGKAYLEALRAEIGQWLDFIPRDEPLGVLFSGGLDSGTVLLTLHDELLARGQSGARLKAFTLAVDGGGEDLSQAREFLHRTGLEFLGEEIEISGSTLDAKEAVAVIEDYKSLDVECATMALALLKGIRERYPTWHALVDGDGGDENFKDYPIEENSELTIRSVVSNRMLYQEGWGIDAIKHSLTYSAGLSRGCVRGYAPAKRYGFSAFSPNTAPAVIAVSEAIPFADLTQGSHEKLYALKGDLLSRGVRQVLGRDLPIFPKRRFQHGAISATGFQQHLAGDESQYRSHFLGLHHPQ